MPAQTRFFIAFAGAERSRWMSHEVVIAGSRVTLEPGFSSPHHAKDPDPFNVAKLAEASQLIYGTQHTWPLTRARMQLMTREYMVSEGERAHQQTPSEARLLLRGPSAHLVIGLLVGMAERASGEASSRFDSIWASGRYEKDLRGGGFSRVDGLLGRLEAFRHHVAQNPRGYHLFVAPYTCYESLRDFTKDWDKALLWEFDDHSDPLPQRTPEHCVLVVALHYGVTHFRAFLSRCRDHEDQSTYLVDLPREQPDVLDAPKLHAPLNKARMSTSGLTLRWQPVPEATSYQVIVSTQAQELLEINQTSSLASDSVLVNVLVHETHYPLTSDQLRPYTQYYWAVRARCPGRSGNRSTCWSFVTGERASHASNTIALASTQQLDAAHIGDVTATDRLVMDRTAVMQRELVMERYELLRVLGEGGFAQVYDALDTQLRRNVALKMMRLEWLSNERMRRAFTDRFTSEATMVAKLDHPHIVPIYDSGIVHQDGHDRPFLVMKMLEGSDLAAVLRRGALGAERVLEIARQVLDTLAFVHANDVIHKDLKPENLFLTKNHSGEDHLYIMDFGISHETGAMRLTETGQFAGTVNYLPPEYLLHQRITARFDVYQIGLILAELLVGYPLIPWRTSVQELVGQYLKNQPVQLPDELRAAGVGKVLARALAFDEEARYANAREFLDEWEALQVSDFPRAANSRDGAQRRRVASASYLPQTINEHDTLPIASSTDEGATLPIKPAPQQTPDHLDAVAKMGHDAKYVTTQLLDGPNKPPSRWVVVAASAVFVGVVCAACVVVFLVSTTDTESGHSAGQESPSPTAAPEPSHAPPLEAADVEEPDEVVAPTRIHISTTPPGALVRLDGNKIGRTPFEHVYSAPKARVEFSVDLDGYVPVSREVEAGGKYSFELVLEQKPKSRVKRSNSKRPKKRAEAKHEHPPVSSRHEEPEEQQAPAEPEQASPPLLMPTLPPES